MKKEKSNLALFLEILHPGLGFIYKNGPKSEYFLLALSGIVLIVLCLLLDSNRTGLWRKICEIPIYMYGLDQIVVNKAKIGGIILWSSIFICCRFSLIPLYKEIKKDEHHRTNQYDSERFKLELSNLFKLKKEELLNEDEYQSKVNQIIKNIKTYGISESKEIFLVNILPLKEQGIITKEILDQLK